MFVNLSNLLVRACYMQDRLAGFADYFLNIRRVVGEPDWYCWGDGSRSRLLSGDAITILKMRHSLMFSNLLFVRIRYCGRWFFEMCVCVSVRKVPCSRRLPIFFLCMLPLVLVLLLVILCYFMSGVFNQWLRGLVQSIVFVQESRSKGVVGRSVKVWKVSWSNWSSTASQLLRFLIPGLLGSSWACWPLAANLDRLFHAVIRSCFFFVHVCT